MKKDAIQGSNTSTTRAGARTFLETSVERGRIVTICVYKILNFRFSNSIYSLLSVHFPCSYISVCTCEPLARVLVGIVHVETLVERTRPIVPTVCVAWFHGS